MRDPQRRGRALGVDLGTVRVGLALSDPSGSVATPLATLEPAAPVEPPDEGWVRSVAVRLATVVREHGCEAVVVGLPRALSGRETASTVLARRVARALEEELRGQDTAVVLWDERLSSVEAERVLLGAGLRRERRRTERDRVAAAIILQSWLDAG
jgi:putative holliday junction resolvase